jgi:hypothetical protein
MHVAAELDRLATVDFYTPASKEDQHAKQIVFQKKIQTSHRTKIVRVY